MVVFTLCFLIGILAVQTLRELPAPEAILYCLPAGLVLLLSRSWKSGFVMLGVVWAVLFASVRLENRLPESMSGQDVFVSGFVDDLPEYESYRIRFNLAVTSAPSGVPHKIRLTWYEPAHSVRAGQFWRFTVRLKPPHGSFNPGGFDYEQWLFVEGLGATGYVRMHPEPEQLKGTSMLGTIGRWRQAIADRLSESLSGSASLPLIKALTIGDGSSLSSRQWEIFRKTGTTHLMVISGSHIGLVAGLVYLLTIKLWSRTRLLGWSPQKAAAFAALSAVFVYAGLTGFTVPAQRAAIMIAVAMIAIVRQRHTRPFTVLATALSCVLMYDPLSVLSPGFWLSFVAVGLIIYSLGGRLTQAGLIQGMFKINWVTSIGLMPILLFYFQQVSLIAPLANLIAVPVIGLVVVPLALSATIILFVAPFAGVGIFFLVDYLCRGMMWLLVRMAEIPAASVSHSQPDWLALAFALPGILMLLAPQGLPSRWLGVVMLFPLIFTKPDVVKPGTAKLTLLDVGQGLSAVIRTANHVLLYDTGAKFSSNNDSGQSVVLPFLRYHGISRINTLVVSHGDNDHIGGAESVLQGVETGMLLTSVPQQLSAFTPVACKAGQSWQWDNVRFTVLSPEPGLFSSGNDNSCVLQVRTLDGTAILTGDIEANAEDRLVRNFSTQLQSDVLIAPHHGSQTSSTDKFLQAVKPSLVLIPAGYQNPFGHPHPEVVKRYLKLSAEAFDTARHGAIQLTIGNPPRVQAWRAMKGKYWNYQ